jgi:very-short-patch-repair endonuclease
MESAGPEAVVRGSSVAIDLDASTSVNYAMQQNDVPVVRSIRIENTGDAAVADLRVRLSASRPVFTPLELRLDSLAPGAAHRFEPVDLVLDPALLCNQPEREQLQLIAEVTREQDGVGEAVLARTTKPLELLAFNEWRGAEGLADLIAAFITPNHPSVEAMLAQTRDTLQNMIGEPSIMGYQGNPDGVRLTVQAAAAAFRAREIGYTNPPASFELSGQKIRSVDQVLDGRLGTCLDLVVALASILEQIGLNTLVVLLRGHAMLGVWLRDDRFPQTVIDDRARLLKRVQLGEVMLIETTALVAGANVSFDAVRDLALKKLEKPTDFVCAVDVSACRRERIRPLPSRTFTGSGFEVVASELPTSSAAELLKVTQAAAGKKHARPASKTTEIDNLDGLSPEAADRLGRWKRKLLDLSMRNRLLNYRVTKRAVALLVPDVAAFEDLLADGHDFAIQPKVEALQGTRDLSAEARRTGKDSDVEILTAMIADGRVSAPFPATDLAARLLEIYREARTSIEESGANTLYLALGSLVWYESESSQTPHVAPLVLVPVTLARDVSKQTFRMERADEEPRVNITLLELLRTDFGIDGSHLERLETDESGYDIRSALNGFIALVKDVPRWEVREEANLSLFSFAKFVMWTDLEMRRKEIASNKVVRRLLERSSAVQLADVEAVEEPDRLSESGGLVPAMDADSSQLSAVHAASNGRTFVLQGPPGTGKSQTITNIVASAIASGKRALFVAEKMAALSVVKSRLQRLGLGHFCLEIHSSKAGKKEVLAQLQEALDAGAPAEPREWAERVRELETSRRELNDYANALHQVRTSGETVYCVIGRRSRLEGAPKIDVLLADPLGVTRERLAVMRHAVTRIAAAAAGAGSIPNHPLRSIGQMQWTPSLAEDIASGSRALVTTADALGQSAKGLVAMLTGGDGATTQASWAELIWLSNICTHMLAGAAPTEAILREPGWAALRESLHTEIARGRTRDAQLKQLRLHYRDSLLSADIVSLLARAKAAAASGFLFRWFKMRSVRAALLGHAITQGRSAAQVVSDLELAGAGIVANAQLNAPQSVGRRLIGSRWAVEGQWDTIATVVDWVDRARSLLAAHPAWRGLDDKVVDAITRLMSLDSDRLAADTPSRRAVESFIEAIRAFEAAYASLDQVAAIRRNEVVADDAAAFLATIVQAAERWAASGSELPDWCAWRQEAAADGVPELLPMVATISRGELAHAQASDAFERAFAAAWLAAIFKVDETLRRFSHTRHSGTLERFRTSDQAAIRLGSSVVRARGRAGAPASAFSQANPESELGVLKRQLQLQRRHMPVRKLVERLPNLLPRLKPCWLMSPVSVAQYLDPMLPPFDIVVFDEASQIPAWDAIGAIARGAEAIVVGDSKQLPPTTFFATQDSDESEDESEFDELESILDESVAANLPTLSLRWHYRSRHESLIAFSNHHYYDNKLLTFPSSDLAKPGLGVSLVYLPQGRYDKGGARTNMAEAEAVVAEIVKRLAAAGAGNLSLGVVTFSVAQQYLIEDLLDAQRRAHPEFERFFGSGVDEPVFIKNLENVQGDERDAILFSVCYGPHNDGPPSMNFGPINRQGGERRLNVAITRARREVIVFTSMRPDQIDLSRTRSIGAAHLRSFLDYAERGPRAILEAVSPGEETESPFEDEVKNALTARGYLVDVQVGCSGYRIDLAVKDPERPGRYLLGIECDGATYHSAKSARDRDRLREQVLRGLGWRIHRVWSTDWLQSRDAAIARLEKAIAEAVAHGESPHVEPHAGPAPVPATTDRSQPLFASKAVAAPAQQAQAHVHALAGQAEYTPAKLSRARRDAEALRDGSGGAQAARDIVVIVDAESPVHVDRVLGVLAEEWQVERMTARARESITAIIAGVIQAGQVVQDEEFLWSRQGAKQFGDHFRVPASTRVGDRPIEHIHPLEIANAAKAVLAHQFSMPISALYSEVAKVFGVPRVTAKVEAAILAGIVRLAQVGGCKVEGDRVSV